MIEKIYYELCLELSYKKSAFTEGNLKKITNAFKNYFSPTNAFAIGEMEEGEIKRVEMKVLQRHLGGKEREDKVSCFNDRYMMRHVLSGLSRKMEKSKDSDPFNGMCAVDQNRLLIYHYYLRTECEVGRKSKWLMAYAKNAMAMSAGVEDLPQGFFEISLPEYKKILISKGVSRGVLEA